jgi:hypothetical protein
MSVTGFQRNTYVGNRVPKKKVSSFFQNPENIAVGFKAKYK